MMASSSLPRWPLAWAAAAPVVCAVHCLASPVLVLLLPAPAGHPWVERWLLVVSAGIALATVAHGVRAHRREAVWLPVGAGLAVWAASLAGLWESLPEIVMTPLGSLAVAAGLLWNSRLRHEAVCRPDCGCPGVH